MTIKLWKTSCVGCYPDSVEIEVPLGLIWPLFEKHVAKELRRKAGRSAPNHYDDTRAWSAYSNCEGA